MQRRVAICLALVLAVLDVNGAAINPLLGAGWNSPQDQQAIQQARKGAIVQANRQRAETQGAYVVCPAGLTPCRVGRGDDSDFSDDHTGADVFECVNVLKDVSNCGGCVLARDGDGASVRGSGSDCRSLPGTRNAQCRRGVCQATSCRKGFSLSRDGTCAANNNHLKEKKG